MATSTLTSSIGRRARVRSAALSVILGCMGLAVMYLMDAASDPFTGTSSALSRRTLTSQGTSNANANYVMHGDGTYQIVATLPPDGPDADPEQVLSSLRSVDPTPLDSECRATSAVRVLAPSAGTDTSTGTSTSSGSWALQSLDVDGQPKRVGGDELYVTLAKASTAAPGNFAQHAVAHVTDNDDGTYQLHFVEPALPPGPQDVQYVGDGDVVAIRVVLQYTCGIGALWPPAKAKWRTGGALNRDWHGPLLGDGDLDDGDKKALVPPVSKSPSQGGINWDQYDIVYAVGDSLMAQFVKQNEYSEISRRAKMRGTKMGFAFRTNTVRTVRSLRDWDCTLTPGQKLQDAFAAIKADTAHASKAIILGSGVWDVLENIKETNLDDHLQSISDYVENVREEVPNADIYWKSMTAMHIHKTHVRNATHIEQMLPELVEKMNGRLSYMSTSRAEALYRAQLRLMETLDVPVLDMYNMTYENDGWTRYGDGRHYTIEFNDWMMDQFYPLHMESATSNVEDGARQLLTGGVDGYM